MFKKLRNKIRVLFNKREPFIDRWDRACARGWHIVFTGPATKEKLERWEKNHAKLMALSVKWCENKPTICELMIIKFAYSLLGKPNEWRRYY